MILTITNIKSINKLDFKLWFDNFYYMPKSKSFSNTTTLENYKKYVNSSLGNKNFELVLISSKHDEIGLILYMEGLL